MEWQMLQGTDPDPAAPKKDLEIYRATCLREGYYLVDFIKRYKPTQSVTLLIDLIRNIATVVLSTMPTRDETFKPLFQRVLDRELLTPMAGDRQKFQLPTAMVMLDLSYAHRRRWQMAARHLVNNC